MVTPLIFSDCFTHVFALFVCLLVFSGFPATTVVTAINYPVKISYDISYFLIKTCSNTYA